MNLLGSLKRHAPTALSILSVVGMVATVVTAVKATPKALEIIEKEEVDKPIDIVKATWKCFVPSAILAAGTTLCIFGSNFLNKKQQLNLAGIYAITDTLRKQKFSTHKAYSGDKYDPESDTPARMVRESCDYCQTGIDFPDEKVLWYDEISGQTFERYEREVMEAEYHLNRNIVQRGYAPLNEFYEFLGLDWCPKGDELGWDLSSGLYWIDFEHKLINSDDGGRPIYEIVMVFPPDDNYMENWDWPHYDE